MRDQSCPLNLSLELRTVRATAIVASLTLVCSVPGAIRKEDFDHEPSNWEGVNNRNVHFKEKTVTQDFGYSPVTSYAGGSRGEIGGKINPAGEPAFYGYRLPKPGNLDERLSASGKIFVRRGGGHFLVGFFNAGSLNGWRTPNTMVARINGRGDGFHCHLEYCTSRWRAGAGIIGRMEPGTGTETRLIPSDRSYAWKLTYDPNGRDGSGILSFTLGESTATCRIDAGHRADGASFTHFGLLPVLKAWDSPGEAWLDDVTIGAEHFNFAQDPKWDGLRNRSSYQTKDTRPRFDFGWSPTHFAGGKAAGELGGLIFRGDCREAARLAAFGDRISRLTLNQRLIARGKISMRRGVSDSTASIGFYNSVSSLRVNPAQNQSIPMDYLGINIEGPSAEGFFFYPVYRVHGESAGASDPRRAPRIYPDGKVHDWSLKYDPEGTAGKGQVTLTLDANSTQLDLDASAKNIGASFDRFGICTPWIDGNSVTVYFDDLEYTCSAETEGGQ